MAMDALAPELLIHIFKSLHSAADIINLSLTCRYFNSLLPKSQKLALFFHTVDQEMGPVEEAIQLLTQNDQQALHIPRNPPLSFALLAQVTTVGRVAQRFVSLYPLHKWTYENSENRRMLQHDEARRLRRAVYRFWSHCQALHSHTLYRTSRPGSVNSERLQLLRSWSTAELLELEDFRGILEQLLASEICPTDGDVFSRHPQTKSVYSFPFKRDTLLDPVKSSIYAEVFHTSGHETSEPTQDSRLSTQERRFKCMQGWGSDLENFYVVQAFLKLTPAQLLWLLDHAVYKSDVEQFVESQTMDLCFLESGSMLFHEWVTVLHQRGVDVQQVRDSIWEGEAGIVRAQESQVV